MRAHTAKLRKVPGVVRAILRSTVRKRRRETVYNMTHKSLGKVPCFVCGKPVAKDAATLEHITPISKGGTDDMSNLAISHAYCNHKRGSE
jgi:5-methylcytosine-specific restriction endonuclease McrA